MSTFGRSRLEHWLLDPEFTYLNHGTVGAPPRRVLQKQQALRDEMERQPSRFLLRELNGHQPMPWRAVSRLREASDQVAAFVGSRPDDLVFVPNVTTGLNAVLQSLPLGPGDDVVITDLTYGAIALAAGFVCDRGGATLRTVRIEYPVRDAGDVVDAIVRARRALPLREARLTWEEDSMATKTFADVKLKAERDAQFFAQLVVNPKKALSDANFELTNSADVNRLELFVRMAQEQLRAAGRVVGIRGRTADWGIGASCCNGRLIMPRGGIAHRGGIR